MSKWLLFQALLWFSGAAVAQPLTPPGGGGAGSPGLHHLYASGTSVGNGADTSADVLQTMTLAAGQLAATGDVISIKTGGSFAASADNKALRVVLGGQVVGSVSGTVAGQINWYCDVQVVKTGSNAQSFISGCPLTAGNSNARSGTLTLTDTGTLVVQVTGQNNTTATAGTITAQALTVDYWH